MICVNETKCLLPLGSEDQSPSASSFPLYNHLLFFVPTIRSLVLAPPSNTFQARSLIAINSCVEFQIAPHQRYQRFFSSSLPCNPLHRSSICQRSHLPLHEVHDLRFDIAAPITFQRTLWCHTSIRTASSPSSSSSSSSSSSHPRPPQPPPPPYPPTNSRLTQHRDNSCPTSVFVLTAGGTDIPLLSPRGPSHTIA
jgi:hypothetical protein